MADCRKCGAPIIVGRLTTGIPAAPETVQLDPHETTSGAPRYVRLETGLFVRCRDNYDGAAYLDHSQTCSSTPR